MNKSKLVSSAVLLLCSLNVLAETKKCDEIKDQVKEFDVSILNGLTLESKTERAVSYNRLTFSKNANMFVNLGRAKQIRMYEFKSENDVMSFVDTKAGRDGRYKGINLKIEVKPTGENDYYEVRFLTERYSDKSTAGNFIPIWNKPYKKAFLNKEDMTTEPVLYQATKRSIDKKEAFVCKE